MTKNYKQNPKIVVTIQTKKLLDKAKLVKSESYEDVIRRALALLMNTQKIDNDAEKHAPKFK